MFNYKFPSLMVTRVSLYSSFKHRQIKRLFTAFFILPNVQIYLKDNECCHVQRSDRLGFMNELDQSALGFVFEHMDMGAMQPLVSSQQLPSVGDILPFISNHFPYNYALAAAYDTGWYLKLCHYISDVLLYCITERQGSIVKDPLSFVDFS
jgi:hypothetical protein